MAPGFTFGYKTALRISKRMYLIYIQFEYSIRHGWISPFTTFNVKEGVNMVYGWTSSYSGIMYGADITNSKNPKCFERIDINGSGLNILLCK